MQLIYVYDSVMSYGEAVRHALERRNLSIRSLAAAVGRWSEHCRRIVRGEPVISEELNARLCGALVWTRTRCGVLRSEKATERFGVPPAANQAGPSGKGPDGSWRLLPRRDRTILLTMARSLAERRRTAVGPPGKRTVRRTR